MHINNLNDDCLHKVFAFLPLNDLLNLEFVCLRWQNIQQCLTMKQTTLKIVASHSQMLNLVQQDSTTKLASIGLCAHYQPFNDWLLLPQLDWFACRYLVCKFPNVKSLLIYGCHVVCKGDTLTFLLSQWIQLECLSLVELKGDICWPRVYAHIEVKAKLKHLSLHDVNGQLKLPSAMSKLEEFTLSKNQQSMQQVLPQLGIAIRRLTILECHLTTLCLSQIAASNSAIANQLTHVAIKSDAIKSSVSEKQLLGFICGLKSLISLDLFTEYGFKIQELFQLRQLGNLKRLSITGNEKADLTLTQTLADYDYQTPIESINELSLDIDIDPETLEVLVLLMPNLQKAAVNFARICCCCPEEPPEMIDIPPLAQDPIPIIRKQISGEQVNLNLPPQPPQPPPSPPPPPLPPPPPSQAQALPQQPLPVEEPTIFQEDNCENCSERAMLALTTLRSLRQLSIIGARCKDGAIKAMAKCEKLCCIRFSACEEYSLKLLLNTSYGIAIQRPIDQQLVVHISGEKFRRIIRLTKKPHNLLVLNNEPIYKNEFV